jgi:hypothetical protein
VVLVEVELVVLNDICSVVVVVGGLVVVGGGLVVVVGGLVVVLVVLVVLVVVVVVVAVVVVAAGATVVVFVVDGTDGDGAIAPEKEEGTEMLGVGVGVGEIAAA